MYAWHDHTSEVELVVDAATREEVFADALLGLAELLDDEGAGEPRELEVQAEARDLPALLADWLSEVVFAAEQAGVVPERLRELRLDGTRASARVAGRAGQPSAIVKAVTYHRLAFESRGETWHARVVLDV